MVYILKMEVKVVNAYSIFVFIVTRGIFSFVIVIQSTKAFLACACLLTILQSFNINGPIGTFTTDFKGNQIRIYKDLASTTAYY